MRDHHLPGTAPPAAGEDVGPLCDEPVGIKNIIDMAGLPAACHSRILLNNIAREDAEVVRRLRQAGAIVIGKDHNPGGPPSVSAVSVAAGLLRVCAALEQIGRGVPRLPDQPVFSDKGAT
ncbi:amidase [Roseomonas sp. ACRSG]|nr:amidase [Roseomonas sp. ACRSG]